MTLENNTEHFRAKNLGALIKTFDEAMHLIPEFGGLNVEVFISLIQAAVKRLATDQYKLLLCGIIAQKFTGRAKGTIRIDTTLNFLQLYKKLRILFEKSQNLSALELQRNTCIQHHNETVDNFINRFLRIYDEIITAVNLQNKGIAFILRLSAFKKSSINRKQFIIFRRNVKSKIGNPPPLLLRIGHAVSNIF